MAFISRYYPIFIATLLMFCTGISPVVNADDVLKRMAVGYQVPSLDGSALGELFGLQRGSLTFQIARVGNTTAAEDSTENPEGVVIEDVKQGQVTDRGWTKDEINNLAQGEPAGKTVDNSGPSKTDDGQGRSDTASVQNCGSRLCFAFSVRSKC